MWASSFLDRHRLTVHLRQEDQVDRAQEPEGGQPAAIKRNAQQVNQMIADSDKEMELTGSRSAAEEPVASSQSVVGNLRRFRFPVWDVRADLSAEHDARGVGRQLWVAANG
jgi:hypothetical protein